MTTSRIAENPIIKVSDVKPSRPDFKVVGAFNAGVAEFGDETILLVRIAEMPLESRPGYIAVPLLNERDGELEILHLSLSDPRYAYDDSRVVKQQGKYAYLTSMSHLRVARSQDGIHFKIDETPALFPSDPLEAWGIEDPRITGIGDEYHITYSAVSSKGVSVRLTTTKDFVTYEKRQILLPPENKDAAIFPESRPPQRRPEGARAGPSATP